MTRRLKQFYNAFGDRGVMFILYAFSVVINSLMTICMELPAVFPEEISAAGIAAYYSGSDWSKLLGNIDVSGGYLHALLYVPLFDLFDNPYSMYKAMLVMNSLIVSLIPLFVYYFAVKLGVERVRHKILAAFCCGMYVSVITSSKFITNDALSSLMLWILMLCVFAAWDKKTRSRRITMSILTGFLCAAAFAVNVELIAAVLSILLTTIFARIFFKEKLLNIPSFVLTLLLSFTGEHYLRAFVMQNAAGSSEAFYVETNFTDAFARVFGEIYVFMTESFGMGALAAAFFVIIVLAWVREGVSGREKLLENGTRVYEPARHKYSIRLTIFAIYQFLTVGIMSVVLPLFRFTGSDADASVGEITANAAPLAIFFVMVFIFRYSADMKKLLLGVGIYAYSCFCFFIVSRGLLSDGLEFTVPFVTPFRFGEGITDGITETSCVIMSSCVFTVFVLLLVFTSCAKKYIVKLFSAASASILIYNTIYAAAYYLPETDAYLEENIEPYLAVSELLYNDPLSPTIVVYEAPEELAAIIQFLKPETTVGISYSGDSVPESCLLIAKTGTKIPFEGGSYDAVGKTGEYTVYAFGESARDFIRYSSAQSG